MLRFHVWSIVLICLVAMPAIGDCQVSQWRHPGSPPHAGFCRPQPRPRPVVRNVRVDVPVPCPPSTLRTPMPACRSYAPCAPACAPCPPTRPVNVRVDVVVRPEAPKRCVPKRFCCENPPVFEPFFYRAACVLRSMLVAPLCLGEKMLGHGGPRLPCPPPIPIACPPRPPASMAHHPGFVNGCPPSFHAVGNWGPAGRPVAWGPHGPHHRPFPTH